MSLGVVGGDRLFCLVYMSHTDTCTHICIHTYIYIYIYIYNYICTYLPLFPRLCARIYTYIYTYACVYTCIYIYMHIYVRIYIDVYYHTPRRALQLYTYTPAHMNTYMYINVCTVHTRTHALGNRGTLFKLAYCFQGTVKGNLKAAPCVPAPLGLTSIKFLLPAQLF